MSAYYNEHDPKAAAWLRELIRCGHIAGGEVDERSIVDVRGTDLAGFTQCHFFAGIGVWSYALRCAGWDDDRPVWTGSCPCQSFSAAGSGRGFDDERHLWPHFFRLIREQRPGTVFGEQVASKDGLAWLDFVCADMEGEGYAIAPLDLCAAGFGAPHIRQRLFFVAQSERDGWGARPASEPRRESGAALADNRNPTSGLADAECGAAERHGYPMGGTPGGMQGEARQQRIRPDSWHGELTGNMGNAEREGSQGHRRHEQQHDQEGRQGEGRYGPTAGFWHDAQWLPCRDGKARPVEPGTFPLAHGVAERVGLLRGYGNAIVAPVAEEFIRAYIECAPR